MVVVGFERGERKQQPKHTRHIEDGTKKAKHRNTTHAGPGQKKERDATMREHIEKETKRQGIRTYVCAECRRIRAKRPNSGKKIDDDGQRGQRQEILCC
jgi:hypothetical protein